MYQYNATAELFINATLVEMERYSTINRYPEILETLAQLLSKVQDRQGTAYEICYDCQDFNKKKIVLEFVSKLSELETFVLIDFVGAYSECGNCIIQSGYSYADYLEHSVPRRVFENMIFVKWFLSIYFYDSEVLGSLFPRKMVPSQNIKILEEIEENLVYRN